MRTVPQFAPICPQFTAFTGTVLRKFRELTGTVLI